MSLDGEYRGAQDDIRVLCALSCHAPVRFEYGE